MGNFFSRSRTNDGVDELGQSDGTIRDEDLQAIMQEVSKKVLESAKQRIAEEMRQRMEKIMVGCGTTLFSCAIGILGSTLPGGLEKNNSSAESIPRPRLQNPFLTELERELTGKQPQPYLEYLMSLVRLPEIPVPFCEALLCRLNYAREHLKLDQEATKQSEAIMQSCVNRMGLHK